MSQDSTNSPDPDAYRTLAGTGESEIKIEGSRFLGRARPVDSEDEADQFVQSLRSKHHDARHVCYGLRVGLGAERIDRSNDDGEPPRTGGFPIWQILEGEDLENSLTVVVRYYGGTKLGTGGLTRAYGNAARAAIDEAGTTVCHPETRLDVTIPYQLYDEFEDLVRRMDPTRIVDRDFTADVDVELAVWRTREDDVRTRLSNFLGVDPDELSSSTDETSG